MKVKNVMNYMIRSVLANTTKISPYIYVPFNPDCVIVKNIGFNDGGSASTHFYISTDLPVKYSNILTSVSIVVNGAQNVYHHNEFNLIPVPISGQYNFEFYQADNSLADLTGVVFMMLQFVEYEK
jgi:hypothetical protein